MKIISYILGLLLLWACSETETGFTVRGKINGYPGTMLFVREITPDNTAWVNDTLSIENGEFVYRGRIESPRLIYFIPQDYAGRYELFLENSDIDFQVDNGNFKQLQIKGSTVHDEYEALLKKSAGLQREFRQYQCRMKEASKNDSLLYRRLLDSTGIWASRFLTFLMEQPDYAGSHVVSYFASEWIKSEDFRNMECFLEGLNPETKFGVYARFMEKTVEAEKRVLPGNVAYDFTLRDTTGKTYRLSDFRGKYVLLEFSASWCGWCKLEIPYLKRVYELVKDKGFVMFTVNLDKERKLWVEDVAKENLPWPVISDLQAFDGELTRQYNVSGIPVIFLIDPEGKIVTNKLRGEQMIEYISRLMEIPSDTTTEKR